MNIFGMKKQLFLSAFLMMFGLLSFAQDSDNTVGTLYYDASQTYPGYNLYYPLNQPTAYLVDNCGRTINTWTDDGFVPGSSVYLLPNGNLLKTASLAGNSPSDIIAGGQGDYVMMKDWDNNLIWEYNIGDTNERMHHDISLLPSGNVLILVWQKFDSIACVLHGRDPAKINDGEIWTETIKEYNPNTQTIDWEWRAWDHLVQDFDPSRSYFGDPAVEIGKIDFNYNDDNYRESYDDGNYADNWLNANSVDYNSLLDQVLISVPGFGEFWIIDHSTTSVEAAGTAGDLIYRWGNPEAYRAGDSLDQKTFFQHDVHWADLDLPNSHPDWGKIALFNNQVEEDASHVHLLIPTFDLGAGVYTMNTDGTYAPEDFDYTYMANPSIDIISKLLSSFQILPNGNKLICAGTQGYTRELNEQDEIVWEYEIPLSFGMPVGQGGSAVVNLNFRMNRYGVDYLQGIEPVVGDYVELDPDTTLCHQQTVDIEEFQFVNLIDVYPNPAEDVLFLSFENTDQHHIEIYDLNGAVIDAFTSTSLNYTLDISEYNSGLYFMKSQKGLLAKFLKE